MREKYIQEKNAQKAKELEVHHYNRVVNQEDSFSQNESGGVRKSGSRSRFLRNNKSKEAI